MYHNIKVLEVSEILFPEKEKSLEAFMLPVKKFGLNAWLEAQIMQIILSFLSGCICHPGLTAVPPAS